MIYKRITSVSAEEVLDTLRLSELPSHGTLLTVDEFVDAVKRGYLTDNNGVGELAVDGKLIKGSRCLMDHEYFIAGKEYAISFKGLKKVFGKRAGVLWHSTVDDCGRLLSLNGSVFAVEKDKDGKLFVLTKKHPTNDEDEDDDCPSEKSEDMQCNCKSGLEACGCKECHCRKEDKTH